MAFTLSRTIGIQPVGRPLFLPQGPAGITPSGPTVSAPVGPMIPNPNPAPINDYQGFGPKLPLSDAGGGTPAAPTPTPTRPIAPPSTARDVGTPSSGLAAFVPGGVYSSHGPPFGLTCPSGQVPTEVPAGSGFWRCAIGSGPSASPSGNPVTPGPTSPAPPAPTAPTSTTTGPSTAPTDTINRLIDLVAAQYAGGIQGGGTSNGGLTAVPVGTADPGASAPASSGKGAAVLLAVAVVALLGYFWYKHKHKAA